MSGKKPEPGKPIGYYPKIELTEAERAARGERLPPKAPKRKAPLTGARLAALVACGVVFLVSLGLLVNYYGNIGRAKNATAQLREIYEESATEPADTPTPAPVVMAATEEEDSDLEAATQAPSVTVEPFVTNPPAEDFVALWPTTYENNPTKQISASFQNLRRQNKDVVGWLTIEDVLDEPVLQRDNIFYLTHDSSGNQNVTGALFLDESCNLRTLDHNNLIHGHNMKEGAMFGSLKKYKVKDASFYKTHPLITFNTLYEEATYVIFAVSEIDIRPSAQHYLPFWLYANFDTEDSFNEYVGRLREYSHFRTGVDVQPGDRLLTLATCTGTDEHTRLLVAARMVRKGEDTLTLKQGILSTTAIQ